MRCLSTSLLTEEPLFTLGLLYDKESSQVHIFSLKTEIFPHPLIQMRLTETRCQRPKSWQGSPVRRNWISPSLLWPCPCPHAWNSLNQYPNSLELRTFVFPSLWNVTIQGVVTEVVTTLKTVNLYIQSQRQIDTFYKKKKKKKSWRVNWQQTTDCSLSLVLSHKHKPKDWHTECW